MSDNRWAERDHALAYLARADGIPHRTAGETVLLDLLPEGVERVLDLGTGDGRLLALVKLTRPAVRGVGIDFSPAMLEAARARFAADPAVEVIAHDLAEELPELGDFDVVVSSFAIHHLPDPRKRALFGEIFDRLAPGGVFCNLDHVASPTPALHARFLDALAIAPEHEDPSNILLDLETQLGWLREIGYVDVDCHWKWLELALMAGAKPDRRFPPGRRRVP